MDREWAIYWSTFCILVTIITIAFSSIYWENKEQSTILQDLNSQLSQLKQGQKDLNANDYTLANLIGLNTNAINFQKYIQENCQELRRDNEQKFVDLRCKNVG